MFHEIGRHPCKTHHTLNSLKSVIFVSFNSFSVIYEDFWTFADFTAVSISWRLSVAFFDCVCILFCFFVSKIIIRTCVNTQKCITCSCKACGWDICWIRFLWKHPRQDPKGRCFVCQFQISVRAVMLFLITPVKEVCVWDPVAFSIPKSRDWRTLPIPGFPVCKTGLELLNWLQKVIINNSESPVFCDFRIQGRSRTFLRTFLGHHWSTCGHYLTLQQIPCLNKQ